MIKTKAANGKNVVSMAAIKVGSFIPEEVIYALLICYL
jgi:hypothetical protein